MMSDICGVYIIKSLESGRAYIGSSKRVQSRILRHINSLDAKKHYNNDMIDEWEKFGEDSFEFALLEECSEDALRARELMWCIKYNTFDPLKGFNRNKPIRFKNQESPHWFINFNRPLKTKGRQFHLLLFLICKMDKSNRFSLSPRDRRVAASACKISLNTLNNYMSSLCKINIISRLENGYYIVDEEQCKWGVYKKYTVDDIYLNITGFKYSD